MRGLLGYSQEQMGAAQWIGHILKRMQLTDPARRKHHVGGQLYAVQRTELMDIMRRYEVSHIES